MKNLILIAFLFLTTVFCAQRSNGFGGSRSPQNQNRSFTANNKAKEIKSANLAGVFYYDVKSVIKKIRVKDKDLKDSVAKALKDYNFKTKEIELLNADKFKALDILMKSRINSNATQSAKKASETNNPREFRKTMVKIIRPIQQEIKENEIDLNVTLAKLLSEKQNKKWLKLQKSKKEKLQPKRPQNNRRGLQQGTRTGERSGRRF